MLNMFIPTEVSGLLITLSGQTKKIDVGVYTHTHTHQVNLLDGPPVRIHIKPPEKNF